MLVRLPYKFRSFERRRFETDILLISNSGEHVMRELAKMLNFSSKYSIETYELMYHLHSQKGELYIVEMVEMLTESSGAIHRSRLVEQHPKQRDTQDIEGVPV